MADNDADRFNRWLTKNPEGTFEQFKKAVRDFNKERASPSVKFTILPDGTVVNANNLSSSEISTISAEHTKAAATNQ